MNLEQALQSSRYGCAAAEHGAEEWQVRPDERHAGKFEIELIDSMGTRLFAQHDMTLDAIEYHTSHSPSGTPNWWPVRENGAWGEQNGQIARIEVRMDDGEHLVADSWDGLNRDASIQRYDKELRAALTEAFPGAVIEIERANGPLLRQEWYAFDAEGVYTDEGNMAVQHIAEQVFEAGDWYVEA